MSSKVASGFHTLLFVVVFVCFKTRFQVAQVDPELAMQPGMSLNYLFLLPSCLNCCEYTCVITPCLIYFFGSCHFFFLLHLLFICVYVCGCISHNAHVEVRGQRAGVVLGTTHRSSGLAASTFIHQAILLAQFLSFLRFQHNIFLSYSTNHFLFLVF